MAKWMQQSSTAPAGSVPDQARPGYPVPETTSSALPARSATQPQQPPQQTIFTKGITVRGEISGLEAIYIDGTIEGEINIPGERVTVGPNGVVSGRSKTPCITAREIVVLGAVRGNMIATDRLEIRATGSVMGDVCTGRLKIEDGSYFQGGIEIRQPEIEPEPEPCAEPSEEHALSSTEHDYAEATF